MHEKCGNYDLFIEDVRPQAAPVHEQPGPFKDEADCCNLCHQKEDCMAFQFFYPEMTCTLVPKEAIWSSPDPNELFIGADGYLVGMKESKVCKDCKEDTP